MYDSVRNLIDSFGVSPERRLQLYNLAEIIEQRDKKRYEEAMKLYDEIIERYTNV